MNIFAVYYDNGESYEDYYCNMDKLFMKKEDAIKYIENKGFILGDKDSCPFGGRGQFWEHQIIDEYKDDDGQMKKCVWGTEYMYIEEVKVH